MDSNDGSRSGLVVIIEAWQVYSLKKLRSQQRRVFRRTAITRVICEWDSLQTRILPVRETATSLVRLSYVEFISSVKPKYGIQQLEGASEHQGSLSGYTQSAHQSLPVAHQARKRVFRLLIPIITTIHLFLGFLRIGGVFLQHFEFRFSSVQRRFRRHNGGSSRRRRRIDARTLGRRVLLSHELFGGHVCSFWIRRLCKKTAVYKTENAVQCELAACVLRKSRAVRQATFAKATERTACSPRWPCFRPLAVSRAFLFA